MEKELILEQLFDQGYAIKSVEIKNKLFFKLRSLTAQDYMDIDPILATTKGTKLYVLQTYGIAKLSKSLVSYKDIVFDTIEEASKFISALPAAIVDIMIKEQANFEKEVKDSLMPENVEESFFDKPGLVEKQEPQPGE